LRGERRGRLRTEPPSFFVGRRMSLITMPNELADMFEKQTRTMAALVAMLLAEDIPRRDRVRIGPLLSELVRFDAHNITERTLAYHGRILSEIREVIYPASRGPLAVLTTVIPRSYP
jgi:hypothetical protein